MKIDHIAIYVENLEATKEFFIKYFNATANNLYHNPKTELSTYFLSFEDNTRLEIMSRPNMIKQNLIYIVKDLYISHLV